MGEKNVGVKIDLAGAVFTFMVFVLIIYQNNLSSIS